ncbi:MAG: hypothetical protein IKJ24_06430 [Clostridia bacterium]|nr:hypothetical protein [Clostridia bacterium]
MKRILFLAFVITLMMSISVTVFAENSVTSDSGTTIDISATFKAGSTAEDVISVDIAWGAMEFEFSEGVDGVWDPSTHQYMGAAESSWSASGNEITVTNHSNVAIKATFTYTGEVETVYGTFTNDGVLALATAVGTARDAAPSDSVALTLGGSLTADTAGKVGTVTITIAKQ